MSPVLPPEVWERVASDRHMSVDDLEALAMTCHLLRDVIMFSRVIWHAVVEDLLAESPNPLLARSMNTQSASSLRKKALRFNQVRNALCKADRTLRVSTWDAQEEYAELPVVLPGTEYAICPLPDGQCAIHLLDLRTGAVSEAWRVARDLISYEGGQGTSKFMLHTSSCYGLIATVTYLTESQNVTPTNKYTVHVLQVSSEDVPRLETLSIIEVGILPLHILVVSNTIMVVNHELALLESSLILSDGAAPLSATRWRWSLPINPNLRHSFKFYAVESDTIIAVSQQSNPEGMKLKVIWLSDFFDPANSSVLTTLVPQTMSLPGCDFEPDTDFRTPCLINGTWHIELRRGTHILALSLACDHSTGTLSSISSPPKGSDIEITGWGTQHVYQFTDQSFELLRLDPRPGVAALERRLSRRTPVLVDIPLENDEGALSTGLSFDEWTGVGIVPWYWDASIQSFNRLAVIIV